MQPDRAQRRAAAVPARIYPAEMPLLPRDDEKRAPPAPQLEIRSQTTTTARPSLRINWMKHTIPNTSRIRTHASPKADGKAELCPDEREDRQTKPKTHRSGPKRQAGRKQKPTIRHRRDQKEPPEQPKRNQPAFPKIKAQTQNA
jgi:hypothetical protein